MPVYEVSHCIPLSREQKDALAEFITQLHATTCVTPRLFVNVSFSQTGAGARDVYSGGKFRGQIVPNHIRATIRTGPSRPKELYDGMGVKIQKKWVEIMKAGPALADHPPEVAKRLQALHGIVFTPMVAAIEHGLVVPAPAEEDKWFKQNLAHFKEQAEVYHNQDVKDMLKEISERDDMKSFL